MQMANVLSQLSSFLRVWHIPSHNLSGQLLKFENCVQWHWDLKKMILANSCLGETNLICQMEQLYKQCVNLVLLIKKMLFRTVGVMCTPLYTLQGRQGMEEVDFWKRRQLREHSGHLHQFFKLWKEDSQYPNKNPSLIK